MTVILFQSRELDTAVSGRERARVWTATLNTALALGSDAIKLLTRPHGQCEVHCWVDGPDRAWLAGIIREGRRLEILRSGMSWEAAADMLESTASGPVVCSHTVCDSFPSFACLPEDHPIRKIEDDEDREEAFYLLSSDEMWDATTAGLRSQHGSLQITPSEWSAFRFGDRKSVFDLRDGAGDG